MKVLYLMVSVLLLVSAVGAAQVKEKVLLVFSYHPEYSWVIEETRGVEDVLEGKGITIEKFYLDTKRRTSAEWKKQVAEDAMKKIEEFKPDLVMVFDDNACELVAKKYIGKTIPFVFGGMNGEPGDYGFPAENITGVLERGHVNESIELLKQLVPGLTKAAIITDNSLSSQAFISRVRKTTLPIEIYEFYSSDDFDTWKARVEELQSKVDVIGLFLYHTIKEKGKEVSLPAEEVLRWTLENSGLPEFSLFDFTVKGGALCGVTLSGYEQGKATAEIALMILAGASPANISIKYPEKGIPMINETRAKELKINIPKDLLQKVEIVN